LLAWPTWSGAGRLGRQLVRGKHPLRPPVYRGSLGHMFGSFSQPITSAGRRRPDRPAPTSPRGVPGALGRLAPGAQVIHVDLDSYEIGKKLPGRHRPGRRPERRRSAKSPQPSISSRRRAAATPRPGASSRSASAARSGQRSRPRQLGRRAMRPARFMAALAERLPSDAGHLRRGLRPRAT